MPRHQTIAVLSDAHYACPAEQARRGHESRVIPNKFLRLGARAYRYFIWMRDPFAHNHLLDRFIAMARAADVVVALGDYSCDTAFVGLSDDATFTSASICLEKLRGAFPGKFHPVVGDHELGKVSLFGGVGGLRLASWHRATSELNIQPMLRLDLGQYTLISVVSSLVGLPVFEPETLANERDRWRAIRQRHLAEIRQLLSNLDPTRKVLLFCHDPTALPFLWSDDSIRQRLGQVELTLIGHLHTGLILWKSRLLAGMPPIRWLGNSVRRMSTALHQARHWRPFNVRLCPALAGSELLKDGGYCELKIDPDGVEPVGFRVVPISRK